VSGKSLLCKCAVSDGCSLDADPAYGCQSDDESAALECDCSTCTCSKGTEEYLYQRSIETKLPISESEEENIKAAIGDSKELAEALAELINGITKLMTRFEKYMDAFFDWLRVLIIGECTDLRNKYSDAQQEVEAALVILQEAKNFRNRKTNWPMESLKIVQDKIDELRKLEFELNQVLWKIDAERKKTGVKCLTDSHCPSDANFPERIYCKSDCKCHECRNEGDCKHPKPKCNENDDEIMVCGDPHIKQTIRGTDRRFCYNIYGSPDSTYLYLHDKDFDVRSTLISVIAHDGELAKYVGSIRITKGRVVIRIDPYIVRVDDNGKVTKQLWKYGELKFDNGHEMVVFDSDTTL
ncbi:unnamed protein product, partial [Owenia fusiformis]